MIRIGPCMGNAYYNSQIIFLNYFVLKLWNSR